MVVDPTRAENVLTNDGTTMRIMASSAGKPSAWNRWIERRIGYEWSVNKKGAERLRDGTLTGDYLQAVP